MLTDAELIEFAAKAWKVSKEQNEALMQIVTKENPLPPIIAACPEVAKLCAVINHKAFLLGAMTVMRAIDIGVEKAEAVSEVIH